MPGNLLFANIAFPSVTGDERADMKRLLNHVYMLQEELRYTMGNLGADNFNTQGIADLSGIVIGDLDIVIKNMSGSIAAVSGKADENEAAIELAAKYTGSGGVLPAASPGAMTDTTKTYLYNGLYYRHNGTAWVGSASSSEASFLLSAINGQSAVKMKADRIDFTGFATFLTADDLGANGTTEIDGGRLKTGTLYADALAKVPDENGYSYIAMQNGFDLRNPSYMNFTQQGYTPYSRAIQGAFSLSFNGDTSLTASGQGKAGNTATPVSGYLRNRQSSSGDYIEQYGLDVAARTSLRLMGQAFGNTAGTDGVSIFSIKPDAAESGDIFYELRVTDAGISAHKVQYLNGTYTTLNTAAILS